MVTSIANTLEQLRQFGTTNDAGATGRAQKMLNVTPDTGEYLELMVKATRAIRVLEIGTSNGYATLWLAKGVMETDGKVTTLERSDDKVQMARENFRRAGVEHLVELMQVDADLFLHSIRKPFDFVFLDCDRSQYVSWWPRIRSLLAAGGVLIADNAVSHRAELAEFVQLVRKTPGFLSSLVPIGNGQFVAYRERFLFKDRR